VRRAVEGAELRRAQRLAAEQAQESQLAIDHASQAIAYVSEDGVIRYANRAAERLAGIPADHAVGRTIWGLSPDLDQQRWAELWRAAAQGPVVDVEAPITRTGGEPRLVAATFERLERDAGALMIVYARDVTERKRAEVALRERDQEFRTLAEAVPQIVWMTDPDGKNTYFTQG
jgi:PAS domain S-box-containing protein